MPSSSRRGLPDNLDPLVDTLSNVVGILVVVIALTQIQVGDAIDRLMEVDAALLPAALESLSALESTHLEMTRRLQEAETRRQRVLDRAGESLDESIAEAEAALELVAALPKQRRKKQEQGADRLSIRLSARRAELEEARAALELREEYAESLRKVPRELVARLPDPTVLTGEEQWILCRHGRIFLADREGLVGAGEKAIGRILVHGDVRAVRPDEYESLAHYLRKLNVGDGNFLWRFVTTPEPRARLEWQSLDPGIEPTRLDSSPELRRWLAERDPKRDFIRFQVWSDSFEAYLEARRVVESAGFRAGWKAFDKDEEMNLPLTFGLRPPPERPVEVD
jgi:hypothetical protein